MAEQTLGALFAEYEQNSAITVLEPGEHLLEVTSATPRGKGIVPVYKVVEGPDTGKRVMAGGFYPGDTEGGRVAFFNKLTKFGLSKEFFQTNPTLSDVAKALVGRVVRVELQVREWNGEPRNEMTFNIKLESAPPLPTTGSVPIMAGVTPSAVITSSPVPEPAPVQAAPPTVSAPVPADDPGF